jgi:GDSL-like Lipase/Acylhydrolase family
MMHNCRFARRSILALTLCLLPANLLADQPPADPARFAAEIASLEKQDASMPSPDNGIVFIGSSNIRKWPLAASFPGMPVVNHGFGGSQLSDSVFYFDRLVPPCHPKLVVLHAGGNDLAAGRSPAQIAADLQEFITKLHTALPGVRLIYLGLIPAPIRWGLREQYHETTRLIHALVRHDRLVTFLDPEKALLSREGAIRPELYIEDHLHLNTKGYEILTRFIARDVNHYFARSVRE